MEYRGVDIDTGAELFRVGPMRGTNNIGEFLAIVHGLAWLRAEGRPGPLYSDSKIAMGWVNRGRARTTHHLAVLGPLGGRSRMEAGLFKCGPH